MPRFAVLLTVAFSFIGSAAGGGLGQRPRPLDAPLTVRCSPPLVTETGVLAPRQFIVVRMAFSAQLGGMLVWTNNANYYSFVGPRSAWFDQQTCARTNLPSSLPRARLVRLGRPELTCVVPGRRLLVHAQREGNASSLSVRAMPHGQLLARFNVSNRKTSAYASRYAAAACDLNP